MEFGAREILIVLGILVLVAIILDVIKRVRASRYENIRMPRKRKQPVFDSDEPDTYGSELPNGGARVVGYREAEEAERIKLEVHKSSRADRPTLKSFQARPAPETANIPETKSSPEAKSSSEIESTPETASTPEIKSTPETGSSSPESGGSKSDSRTPEHPVEEKRNQEETARQKSEPVKSKSRPASHTSPQGKLPLGDETSEQQVSLVIAMHVVAKPDDQFNGDALKEALLEKELRYGSMKIFHRHTEANGAGAVMFSVANLVKPGTFDLNNMEQFTTPGVTLFFDAADVEQPQICFDQMLETAKYLASNLDGDLKDETRSDLTRQTIEHYREKISELTRARRLGVK